MKIVTERLVLRELASKDLERLSKYAGEVSVSGWLGLVPHPYTRKQAKEFLAITKKHRSAPKRTHYHLVIAWKSEDELLGVIGIHDVDRFQGTATIGYWLGTPFHRKGIMTEAFTAALDFCFLKMKLRRVNIGVYVGNKASIKLIEKMCFQYEGVRKQARRSLATGKVHDELLYGLLKKDWLVQRLRLRAK